MEQFAKFARNNGIKMAITPIESRTQKFDSNDDAQRISAPDPVHFHITMTLGDRLLWSGEYSIGCGIAERWARKNLSKVTAVSNDGYISNSDIRDMLKNPLPSGRQYRNDTTYWKSVRAAFAKAAAIDSKGKVLPVADVLWSLQMDCMGADQNFEDWAGELGYSADFISAKRIWETVNETRRNLRDGMGPDLFAEFEALEEA